MKKVLFIAVLFAASFAGNAQTSKGTYLLGGGAGFNSYKPNGGSSTTSWNISPRAGYFVIDNLAIGASLGINGTSSTTTTNFGPFARYYFTSFGKSAKLFGNVGANFGKGTTDVGAAVGLAYFLNSSIAVETALGYTSLNSKASNIGLNVGFQIHFKK